MQLVLLTEQELRNLIIEATLEAFGETKADVAALQPTESKPVERLLSQQETAEILGISVRTLIKYRAEGRIPFHRIGRRVLYKRSELFEALHSSEQSIISDGRRENGSISGPKGIL